MAIDALLADLRRDEGLRLKAYPDPLSGGAPWTIGYGHTGPEVKPGVVWTKEQCETALLKDVAKHDAWLDSRIPWWRTLDPVRRDVLSNMCFNLGINGLVGFKNTLKAIRAGEYELAARGMAGSLWARQVGARANRLVQMMRTGKR